MNNENQNEEDIDLSFAAVPKSDQLNADDLISGPITATITKVTARQTREQPISCYLDAYPDRPWKPCLTMIRLMIELCGKRLSQWQGKRVTLYRDPTASYGGQQVGGIRVSHIDCITEPHTTTVTVSRGKRKQITIMPLEEPTYPQEDFDKNLPVWLQAIKDGKMTAAKIRERASTKGRLTPEMVGIITNVDQIAKLEGGDS